MYLFKIMGINDESRKEMEETEGVKKMEPLGCPNKNPRRSNVHPVRTSVVQTSFLKEHRRLKEPSSPNIRCHCTCTTTSDSHQPSQPASSCHRFREGDVIMSKTNA